MCARFDIVIETLFCYVQWIVRVCTLVRMDDALTVIWSVLLSFQWIVMVCTLVRMADVLTVILSDVLLLSLFSMDCDGMHTCQNG